MRIVHPPIEVLYARARRERAEAIHQLVIVPIARLFRRKTGKPAPRTVHLRSRPA
jgi:hypothetical protein